MRSHEVATNYVELTVSQLNKHNIRYKCLKSESLSGLCSGSLRGG